MGCDLFIIRCDDNMVSKSICSSSRKMNSFLFFRNESVEKATIFCVFLFPRIKIIHTLKILGPYKVYNNGKTSNIMGFF